MNWLYKISFKDEKIDKKDTSEENVKIIATKFSDKLKTLYEKYHTKSESDDRLAYYFEELNEIQEKFSFCAELVDMPIEERSDYNMEDTELSDYFNSILAELYDLGDMYVFSNTRFLWIDFGIFE